MFFLKENYNKIQCRLFSKNKIEFPLRVQKRTLSGKTFFFASQKVKGSLTVEAAFIMPFMIFFVALFSYLMMIMGLQMKLQEALDMAGRRLAEYAYIYEQIGEFSAETEEEMMQKELGLREFVRYGLNSAYAWKLVREYAGEEWLNHYCIANGQNGVWIAGGDMLSEDGIIDLALHYIVKIPYLPGEKIGIHLVSRCRVKAWTGFEKKVIKEEDKTEEEIVYITETGSVYHTNINCTHLKLSIDEVALFNLEYIRNQGGGKYYACERCCQKQGLFGTEKVFVTKTGNRYHCSKGCSGLKRTIIELPISQIGTRSQCKRCIQSGK